MDKNKYPDRETRSKQTTSALLGGYFRPWDTKLPIDDDARVFDDPNFKICLEKGQLVEAADLKNDLSK